MGRKPPATKQNRIYRAEVSGLSEGSLQSQEWLGIDISLTHGDTVVWIAFRMGRTLWVDQLCKSQIPGAIPFTSIYNLSKSSVHFLAFVSQSHHLHSKFLPSVYPICNPNWYPQYIPLRFRIYKLVFKCFFPGWRLPIWETSCGCGCWWTTRPQLVRPVTRLILKWGNQSWTWCLELGPQRRRNGATSCLVHILQFRETARTRYDCRLSWGTSRSTSYFALRKEQFWSISILSPSIFGSNPLCRSAWIGSLWRACAPGFLAPSCRLLPIEQFALQRTWKKCDFRIVKWMLMIEAVIPDSMTSLDCRVYGKDLMNLTGLGNWRQLPCRDRWHRATTRCFILSLVLRLHRSIINHNS